MNDHVIYHPGAIHFDMHREGNAPLTKEDREMALAMMDKFLKRNHQQSDFSEAEEVVAEEMPETKEEGIAALLQQLTPMFFGDNAAAADFLQRIKGVKAQDVTSIVNELVKEKVLSANCAHRDLWKVLHEADLYPRSESNWNIFVK